MDSAFLVRRMQLKCVSGQVSVQISSTFGNRLGKNLLVVVVVDFVLVLSVSPDSAVIASLDDKLVYSSKLQGLRLPLSVNDEDPRSGDVDGGMLSRCWS